MFNRTNLNLISNEFEEENFSEIVNKSRSIFSSSDKEKINKLIDDLNNLLICLSWSNNIKTNLRKTLIKSFSCLPDTEKNLAIERSSMKFSKLFNENDFNQHRTEFLFTLNNFIEISPFGFDCLLIFKDQIWSNLIEIGENLLKTIRSNEIPQKQFELFQEMKFYLKILVQLLTKFNGEIYENPLFSQLIEEIFSDEDLTLEIRLTCSLIWNLLKENQTLNIENKIEKINRKETNQICKLSLFFGLTKTMINSSNLQQNDFIRLIEEIYSLKSNEMTKLVALAKTVESYSNLLKSTSIEFDKELIKSLIDRLLKYSWDNFSSNIETIRHCSSTIYSNVFSFSMKYVEIGQWTIDNQLELLKEFPWGKEGSSIVYKTLIQFVSVKTILQWDKDFPSKCLISMNDRGFASESSYLYSTFSSKHRQEENNQQLWKSIWFDPLIKSIDQSNSFHRSMIVEYTLTKFIKANRESLQEIQFRTKNDRTRIVFVRVGRRLGFIQKLFNESSLINEDFLRQGLASEDEEIRLESLFILCEQPKTTEQIPQIELDLIEYFLEINLDLGSTSFRNQIISLMKKHFSRIKDSWLLQGRTSIKTKTQQLFQQQTDLYRKHIQWIVDWSTSNLYLESSYGQRHLSIEIFRLLIDQHGCELIEIDQGQLKFYKIEEFLTDRSIDYLFHCLWDSYEDIRQSALEILVKLKCLSKKKENIRLEHLFDRILNLLSSSQPPETASGASLIQCLAQIPIDEQFIRNYFNEQNQEFDQIYLFVSLIRNRLKNEVEKAKINFHQSTKTGPMYGALSGINSLLKIFQEKSYNKTEEIQRWRLIFTELIDLSMEIASIAGPIVSSSSPEGIMPMELNTVVDHQQDKNITSQMILVCSWRNIKEISILFSRIGEISIEFIQSSTEYKFLNFQQIERICDYFMEQLLKGRHCGAYELAYTGFVRICRHLWNSTNEQISSLIIKWIEDGIKMVKENNLDENNLCLTRRSGGLPFYLQSILTDEPIKERTQERHYLAKLIETLLNIIEDDDDYFIIDGRSIENSRKIHALNTVRSFYRNQKFSVDVGRYVERGLRLSIIGSTSNVWMIRNSSNLLLSTIIQRIFGPSKTKNEEDIQSKKNTMTSREFFNKYPNIFHFFIDQLKGSIDFHTFNSNQQNIQEFSSNTNDLCSSSLFSILLIVRRLYPSPLDGIDCSRTLEQILPFLFECEKSPSLRIREHSSKALLSLIPVEQYSKWILIRLELTQKQIQDKLIRSNQIHGRFLQINSMLKRLNKDKIELKFNENFPFDQIIESIHQIIHESRCSMIKSSSLNLLFELHLSTKRSIIVDKFRMNFLHFNKISTIGREEFIVIVTKFVIRLNIIDCFDDLLKLIEINSSELYFVETIIDQENLHLFEEKIEHWTRKKLIEIDLFNELFFTKLCQLLGRIIREEIDYKFVFQRLINNFDKLRRPISLTATFDLISKIFSRSKLNVNENVQSIKILLKIIEQFVNDEMNDETASAIIELLSNSRKIFNEIQEKSLYWKLIIKISSIPSDIVRQKFVQVLGKFLDEKLLKNDLGVNLYLSQRILFEKFIEENINDDETRSTSIEFIQQLFVDLIEEIQGNDDQNDENEDFQRRLWPSSEGYNNVFLPESESCDFYSYRYGFYLLRSLDKFLSKSTNGINNDRQINILKQFDELIQVQEYAHQFYLIRQRSTVRLNLIKTYLEITKSLDKNKMKILPFSWIDDRQII